jgi:hypothetical protein
MKTRSGFVSNSSTTSFCIYGIISQSDGPLTNMLSITNASCLNLLRKIKEVYTVTYNEYFLTLCKRFEEKKDDVKLFEMMLKINDYTDLQIMEAHCATDDEYCGELFQYLTSLLGFLDLSLYLMLEYNTCYLGRDFSTIGDDETGGEFKQRVKETLTKLFGQNIEIETHDECITT